jgi:hypothetical protein
MSIAVIFPRKDLINARAYRLLKKAVLDVAIAQVYADGINVGVAGGVLSEEEYIQLPGVLLPFVPPVYPGDFPAAAAAQKVYAHNLAKYDAYSKGMSNVRAFLVASIDEDMMATLDELQLGFRFSVLQILAALEDRFARMSPLDLSIARAAVATQYVHGGDMRIFIKLQRELHLLLAENLAIVSESDKFANLLASVSSCGQFTKVIDNYMITHTTVNAQTFQSLALVLVNAAESPLAVTVYNYAHMAGDEPKADAVVLTGKQPINPQERIVTLKQFLCPKHKWQNTIHQSEACRNYVAK